MKRILLLQDMKKIYHLATCSTCKRIIKELNPGEDVVLQDIKTEKISQAQLEEMAEMSGSYESLFSRRAILYKQRDLKSKVLTENDYKSLILEEYTFLKRPVIIVDDKIFIGNTPKMVHLAKAEF